MYFLFAFIELRDVRLIIVILFSLEAFLERTENPLSLRASQDVDEKKRVTDFSSRAAVFNLSYEFCTSAAIYSPRIRVYEKNRRNYLLTN